jgi:hypothetical protein
MLAELRLVSDRCCAHINTLPLHRNNPRITPYLSSWGERPMVEQRRLPEASLIPAPPLPVSARCQQPTTSAQPSRLVARRRRRSGAGRSSRGSPAAAPMCPLRRATCIWGPLRHSRRPVACRIAGTTNTPCPRNPPRPCGVYVNDGKGSQAPDRHDIDVVRGLHGWVHRAATSCPALGLPRDASGHSTIETTTTFPIDPRYGMEEED